MKQFKLVNNLVGWVIFAIAAFTYVSTIEPSASFWDCPEFISTAYKLEIGHPPGAPFFMLTANLFTHFAKDAAHVAMMVNTMSALLSAFCILFLFWSITHLTRKLICKDGCVISSTQLIVIMGAGIAGALAYAWSDTFWFSAEEGEVYAYSSMFTALVFWLILKWEERADQPHADRWLVLIFYLTGLSIGVHLLNLLCLPAIALVYYYKKYPKSNLKGSLIAVLIGFVLVAAVLYGVVPGIVKVGGWFELLFVNDLGLPFNSGFVVYIILLIAAAVFAIWSSTTHAPSRTRLLFLLTVALLGIPFYGTGVASFFIGLVVLVILYYLLQWKRKDKSYVISRRILNTALLCMFMLMIGYSSYSVVVIRSTQNPPMDQDSPEDVFTLGGYLSREQYGSRPLLKGPAFSSYELAGYPGILTSNMSEKWHRVEKASKNEKDKYEGVETLESYGFPSALTMWFPRMYSQNPAHAQAYNDWLGKITMNPVSVVTQNGDALMGEMPSQIDNIRFFLSYQINFMYWRYFLWNFAGRQNGLQGNGELEHGNWITGFAPIDNFLYGNQKLLPDSLKHDKGHNVFYCLPLLLGLFGLFWQASRGKKGIQQFWVVFFLFFMTGLAIILYLNQTPQQPRERDYAYAGSFYAFTIWIGLGVAALADWIKKLFEKTDKIKRPALYGGIAAAVLGILVPIQMVSQTWDDHDRSGRYACRDFGLNYLNTMPEKLADGTPAYPIIFSNGDNDTFPLWYNQETEGKRTDARVCNMEYLNTDWYTDQMKQPAYQSPPLPISWKRIDYVDNGKHTYFPIRADLKSQLDSIKKKNPNINPYELCYIMDHYVKTKGYFPTDSVVVNVNKQNVINQGMALPYGKDSIPDHISLKLNGRGLYRNMVMIYEMLARNQWKRPMYMTVTLGMDNFGALKDYLVLEGLAYRITPFKTGLGRIDTDKMYDNMMHRFRYGNVSKKGIYLDETNLGMCRAHRHMFVQLANQLILEGKKEKALKVMEKCEKELPVCNVPYDFDGDEIAEIWAVLGQKAKAVQTADLVAKQNWSYINWCNSIRNQSSIGTYSVSLARALRALLNSIQILQQVNAPSAKVWEMKMTQLGNTYAGQVAASAFQQYFQPQTQSKQTSTSNSGN